jgi:hypothetical protein
MKTGDTAKKNYKRALSSCVKQSLVPERVDSHSASCIHGLLNFFFVVLR